MSHQLMDSSKGDNTMTNIAHHDLSHQDEQYIQAALEEAQQSPCNMKHGAIAVASGKIIGRGYNHYRCQSRDGIVEQSCTCHAEMAAMRQILHQVDNTHCHFRHSIKVA